MNTNTQTHVLNGLDLEQLQALGESVATAPARGRLGFFTTTTWTGALSSQTRVVQAELGGERMIRDHTFVADEPVDLLGHDLGPNPQELLMGAIAACMTVGYAANASAMGIALESLEIRMYGAIDLRGFFGLDPEVRPGMPSLESEVRVKADATPAQLQALHDRVLSLSPNLDHLTRAVPAHVQLIVEG